MKKIARALLLVMLAGCGGGSGGSGSNSNAANIAPSITDPGIISVADGETTVTTISARDANGDSLAYSLSGADSALFSISNTGVLRFLAAVDYEAPNDSDRNNIYAFAVNVTDGQATTSVEVSVTVVERVSDYDRGIFQDGDVYANMCGDPRTGTDPFDGSTYPDR
ncbi:MAG: hypothetical protein GWP50_08285 [Proteobacteria bacterium]|nr:hypothetical protein [Pseudomonadota bacterium]